ncbi:probable LRR receptor-like serine/threonine-protein kinase At3g47570 [Oryza brachyantha]|uniref:non-specific serine/threonine protein kinase n=1 Tax=Oryza brachyantha TaxID=4533 RepID=J3LW50_ORYBR|nr:probable LRR receptor-like serine/threonine-protein kinase At3g47570 [Oryza brachyantha]
MFPSAPGAKSPAASHPASFLLCIVLIFLSCNTITPSSAQPSNRSESELQALLCFKQSVSNDPTGAFSSWSVSVDFCRWNGVTCGRTSPAHVVSIDLTSMKLSGALPDCLGNLTALQTLLLARNNLEGTIPESLARSLSLVELNLSRNNLSGEIPPSLFNGSSNLVSVDLQMNNFVGKIPLPRNMAALQFLGLTGNKLYGRIPASLANISSLSSILLGQNMLSGLIPESLGQITNLSTLDLSINKLSGYVPATLYNKSSLELLRIGNNSLIGKIPPDIGHTLPNVKTLIMSMNSFHGSIPASLNNASNLEMLDLSSNLLSGFVPALGSLRNMNKLFLGNNSLEAGDWSFITSLTNCTQLLELWMDRNKLKGSLPKSVGNLSTHLETLKFGGNQISGTIPDAIGNFINLTLLEINSNMLSGKIPQTIGNLRKLFILNLSVNKLSGQIPSSIGNLSQLGQLYLNNNNLSGNIPTNIGQCKRLNMLNLSVNILDGSIPVELVKISSLSLGLDLSNNRISGSIPQEVGFLSNLGLLNFSNNQLSGEIPSSLDQCVLLLSLNMEGNNLSGIIPQSLYKLKAIQEIDLSENSLSGQVPMFFEDFTSLAHLNLSYNNFEGQVPTRGIFQYPNSVNLEGNKGLCALISIFALQICPTSSAKKKTDTRLLLIVIPPISIALFSILSMIFTLIKGSETHQSSSYQETMKRVSYGDILKATSWFSHVNKISSSRTASVYIGRFEFGTDLVAIKVFHLDEQSAHNIFFTECEVQKRTRHRNLVKAITLCSTVDFDNNEFKALVYEFMANGSLEMFVHSKMYQGSPKRVLTLGQRISIAADVASALDYLHNQLVPPMIHCDLKPSNILLDYDMTSRIGDFGSAKFLSSSCTNPEGFDGFGGTIGYIAPEYGMGCKLSTSGDVYSFGVVLLEMFTAKRPTDTIFGNDLSLHKYVDLAFPDRIGEVLDPHMPLHEKKVVHDFWIQSFTLPMIEIALLCSKESPKDRPGMREVCTKIASIKQEFDRNL